MSTSVTISEFVVALYIFLQVKFLAAVVQRWDYVSILEEGRMRRKSPVDILFSSHPTLLLLRPVSQTQSLPHLSACPLHPSVPVQVAALSSFRS